MPLQSIIKLLLLLAVTIGVLSILFVFGLFILTGLAIIAPFAYLYIRIRHPGILEAIKQARAQKAAHAQYNQNQHAQQPQNAPINKDDVIEGSYEKID